MKAKSKSVMKRAAIMKTLPREAELDVEFTFAASRGTKFIPALGFAEEAVVYDVGAEKHGADSWRDGMLWSKCVIKLQRHLGEFLAGRSRCSVDGQHHLASVKFWCNALMEYEQTHPDLDDVRKHE